MAWHDGQFASLPWVGLGATGGSGGAFSPASLSALQLWLDANYPASINSGSPTDGDSVQFWNDRSAVASNFFQNSSTNQPTYKTGILNGLPGILYSDPSGLVGSSTVLTCNTVDMIKAGTPFSIYMVYTFNNYNPRGTNVAQLLQFAITGSGLQPALALTNTTGYKNAIFSAQNAWNFASFRTTDTFATLSRPYIMCLTWNGTALSGMQFYSANSTLAMLSAPTDNIGSGITSLGGQGANNANCIIGYIHEVVIDWTEHDATTRASMQTYLSTKWGTIAV